MFQIIVHKRAARYLEKLPYGQKKTIKKILSELRINPVQHSDVKLMLGKWKGYYRIRVGDRRVIFWIDKNEKILYVDHIGPRGDIYK